MKYWRQIVTRNATEKFMDNVMASKIGGTWHGASKERSETRTMRERDILSVERGSARRTSYRLRIQDVA